MFKTFPEFSKLNLSDKEEYERLIRDYPPLSELAFATLMLWWNHLDTLAISMLGDNLVISYWLPGDESRSGLCFVGNSRVDESICTIFDYQSRNDRPCRLIHVPEFVTQNMRYPEMFKFTEERDYDEYIVPVSRAYPMENLTSFRRIRARRLLREIGEPRIKVGSLDLSNPDNAAMMIKLADNWTRRSLVNKRLQLEEEAMRLAIRESRSLGVQNVSLFIDGVLEAFCLYYQPSDKSYAILSRARCNDDIPRLFDYMLYAFAEWFVSQGIEKINMDIDHGRLHLRALKLVLGPVNFFRKYTIEPAN